MMRQAGDRQAALFASLAGFAYGFAALRAAAQKPFWMDEALAVIAATRESYADVWRAIWGGAEFSPPTYHFLLHGLLGIAGPEHQLLAARLPSILAILGAAACVGWLLRGRVASIFAALGFALALDSSLFTFAVQARPYGLLALCCGLALLAWDFRPGQDDPRTPFPARRALALWMALSAAVSLNFYGVLIPATLGLCEALFLLSTRVWRLPVWGAITGAGLTALCWSPLALHLAAMNASDTTAPEYYAAPTAAAFLAALFVTFFATQAVALLYASAGISSWALTWALTARLRKKGAADPGEQRVTAGRGRGLKIMLVALVALPLVGFTLAVLVTGSFSQRYISAAALAPGALLALWLARGAHGPVLAKAVLVLASLQLAVGVGRPDHTSPALELAKENPDGPLVIGEGLLFIEMWQADPDLRARLVYLTRPDGAASPDPTNENQVRRLRALLPGMKIEGVEGFLARESNFQLLVRPGGTVDTTSPAILASGRTATLLFERGRSQLFRIGPR